mgnify:CR=1 FL=1
MRRELKIIIWTVIILAVIFASSLVSLYTDWLWFGEAGYRSVFWTQILYKLALGASAGILFFAIVYANIRLAGRLVPTGMHMGPSTRSRMGEFARRGIGGVLLLGTIVAAVLVGLSASSHWMSLAMWMHAVPFPDADPVFKHEIGFYIFKLGFLKYIYGWLMFTLIVALLASVVVHYADRAIDFLAGTPTFAPHVKAHLSMLLAVILFLRAWGYLLQRYDLLYSPTGVIFGAGYTDIHARMAALVILAVVAVAAGILSLVNIYRRGIILPAAALVILVAASALIGSAYPAAMQQIYVKPNEIARESPYITYNIKATRKAFNLDVIQEVPFTVANNLTAADINRNRPTINSIRVWDYRPLDKTYSQLQSLWQYYDIPNIDVDRYTVNGILRQVTVAARELSIENTQAGSLSWVNRHFQYTHGYGAVMSPVNRATAEGLPEFFIQGIPPVSSVDIKIDRPQIYFGERTSNYVVVDSTEKEFDYPSADQPKYTSYAGTGGIPIGNYFRRIAFAWRFGDLNLILKSPVTKNSRLMFRREIADRVRTIFPFLAYDKDPYLVVSGGRLFWIWDAYSASSRYPYSKPYANSNINYIRNAAKVVIDAYNGTVDYYMADETDPLVQAYSKIFPGVFKPMSAMPADLRTHIRYPEQLFRIQAGMLLTYHMQNPQVFYNRGDLWEFPKEIVQTSGMQTPIEPYYVVMTLPGETKEEFLLMLPFTPVNKDNMVAWIAARCDPADYGRMILYQFPKDKLVYGPAQIESRINQDPAISPQLTLWNQQGSQVNRGNLLVIPIDQSILYVKPIYLESQTSKIPELKRVVAAYGSQLVMEPTLDAAIARIFGGGVNLPQASATPAAPLQQAAPSPQGRAQKLAERAIEEFRRAQEAQRKGDWAGYGEEIKRLERTLQELKAAEGG